MYILVLISYVNIPATEVIGPRLLLLFCFVLGRSRVQIKANILAALTDFSRFSFKQVPR
jgi:cytosine/uracil/thiamine/allantoin permease